MTYDEKIDLALDKVLRAAGSQLQFYTMQSTLDAMRGAMQDIMTDSFVEGSKNARKAIETEKLEAFDSGPWIVSEDGRRLNSDDFTHDVQLDITGDFADESQRFAYAVCLAEKLNN